ncbi:hypothetical protein [Clostridium tagluense]|uniref:hypothetical protein n=1 Tax=Clostridium tagluense TaxID=360422 RepID=UPI001C0CEB88|nr:hypothetical protein [Clostridium tagluense]MBU3127430.1 hypothetical protein [Clostridium tagluense]
MYKKATACLLTLLLAFSFVGCSKPSTKEVTKEIPKSITKEVPKEVAKDKQLTLGKNEGNLYTNDFFKMNINIPDKWIVATDEEKTEVLKLGKEVISKDDKSKAKELDLSELRTVYLLMTSQKGLKVQSTTANPNFIVIAEKLSFFQGVKDGANYLGQVKKQLKTVASTMPYKFDKEIYTEKVGGKSFSVLEATIETGTIKMTQKYYACVLNGYALSFISTYTDDVGAKSLDGVIKSVTFK